MAVATALPHVQAFMTILDALPWDAYLGEAPDNATVPYVVVYPDSGTPETTSLVPDEGFVGFLSLHGIGEGPDQAIRAIDRARTLLVGAQPSVSGRYVWRIWQEPGSPPISRDDDVQPPLFVAFAEFGMRSEAT